MNTPQEIWSYNINQVWISTLDSSYYNKSWDSSYYNYNPICQGQQLCRKNKGHIIGLVNKPVWNLKCNKSNLKSYLYNKTKQKPQYQLEFQTEKKYQRKIKSF